jgi:hypothetical protein
LHDILQAALEDLNVPAPDVLFVFILASTLSDLFISEKHQPEPGLFAIDLFDHDI